VFSIRSRLTRYDARCNNPAREAQVSVPHLTWWVQQFEVQQFEKWAWQVLNGGKWAKIHAESSVTIAL
jgi:hypothetical protein